MPTTRVLQADPAPRTHFWEESVGRGLWRMLRHNRNVPIGAGILTAVILVALLAPWLAPRDPLEQDLGALLQPPVWADKSDPKYLLGTDDFGRDVLSRVIYGSRISLMVGLGVITLSGITGVVLGLVGGYLGGWTDTVIMRLADVQQALPDILLAIIITATLGASIVNLILVLAISSWPVFARIVYSAVRSLKDREFVQASVAVGASVNRILFRHILPNLAASIIIVAALQMGRTILVESALSFLGLGVPPPAPSWGGMVSDGRYLLPVAPWVVTIPGLAILITVWGINLLGDGLRRALDPRLFGLR
jgi:peptide/nickel transport system permease protein